MTDPSAIDRPVEQKIIRISVTRAMVAMLAGPLGFCLYCLLWGSFP